MRILRWISAILPLGFVTPAFGQTSTFNLYGMPGLIDMPTAESAPDAELGLTVGSFAGITRGTLSFQITPRLSGSFRYTGLASCNCFGFQTYYDRSFDLHYVLADEGRIRPAIAIGLRDFVGTGIYSSEYLVATKRLGSNVKVTGGIGWGRLGSYNSFTNPLSIFGSGFNTRPSGFGLGGVPGFSQWFRGPAALFAGVEWQTPVHGLSLKAEYSSDAYTFETGAPNLFTARTPLNFSLDYKISPTFNVSGFVMHGSVIGIRGSMTLNPQRSLSGGSREPAPFPIYRRPRDNEPQAELVKDTDWVQQADAPKILMQNLNTMLEDEGITVESLSTDAYRTVVRVRSKTYDIGAQTIGRVARMMTRLLPLSVETFVIVPVVDGLPTAAITLRRTDLEDLEFDPNAVAESFSRAELSDAAALMAPNDWNADLFPHLAWNLGPYRRASFFDPDVPFRFELGLRAKARYDIRPGLSISGSIAKRAVGNMHTSTRLSNSVLQHVRSDFGIYDRTANLSLEYLTADYLFRPGRNLFGRVSAGYLERMYGGISSEILWKPVNSRLALGAEVNLVKQRAFDLGFGFQSYQTVTAHLSGYYDFRNGFSAQVDVGRYLAGDWGGTLTLARRFDNGWRVGAFMTLTNVPFSTFGEGSFDKGLILEIPFSWAVGRPTPTSLPMVIRPVTRDGGARLTIRNRLYPMLHKYHRAALQPSWGRFWK